MKFTTMLACVFFLVACGGQEGVVVFELAIDNDNNRTVQVDFNGELRSFTIANVITILDKATLVGDNEEAIIDVQTPFVFGVDAEVEVEVVVPVGDFNQVDTSLGIADAETALAAGEENVLNRSFHLEGSIDADGDGIEETDIVVYAPAAQDLVFNQAVSVVADQEVVVEILIDLQLLLDGVDFSLAENVGGELSLTEDNENDQTPVVSANVPDAFQLILE